MIRGQRSSLKARALQLLARRDYSRAELRRKLLPDERAGQADAQGNTSLGAPSDAASDVRIEELLDWLEAKRYLSDARFIEARVHAREPRFGPLRIRRELAQHGIELDPAQMRTLQDTELDRARAVWARKFTGAAADPGAQARQARFLARRGFSLDVIRRVLGGIEDDGDS